MMNARGFVLINALVLVAAMASVAVLLLSRAEAGRQRLSATGDAAQLSLLLDGMEALAITTLDQDLIGNSTDHTGEGWANPIKTTEIDRGTVSGQITDLQSRFNINWIINANDDLPREALERLLTRLGLSAELGPALLNHLQQGGPDNKQRYTQARLPIDPVGGAILYFRQLADVPGLKPEDLEVLAEFVTALPGDSQINVNTASPEVLIAMLPQIRPAILRTHLQGRVRDPFPSVDAFLTPLELALDPNAEEGEIPPVNPDLFAVSSAWFQLDTTAGLGHRDATRRTVLRRLPFPAGTGVLWRITTLP